MQDVIVIAVYFVGLFSFFALIRAKSSGDVDSDDVAYFLSFVWPVMLFFVPFFVVGCMGAKVGAAIKQWRHDC